MVKINKIDIYKDLPPLTEVIDDNDAPESKFKQLIKIFLTRYGSLHNFKFETSDREVSGFDGIVYENYPETECPVIFHIIWVKGAINREPTASSIEDAFNQCITSLGTFKSYILVTPRDLSEVEAIWLNGFQRDHGIKTYHTGHKKMLELMELCPALRKYYYGPGWEVTENFSTTDVRYKDSVTNNLKYLEFIGLPTLQYKGQNFLKSTKLKEIYIPLFFQKDQRSMVLLTLSDVIKESDRNVILGDPGTGKSTLAKYLTLVYADEIQGNDEFKIESKTPFIITIRDYVWIKQKKSDSFDFIDYLVYTAENNYGLKEIDKDFFIALLELGKAFVLFDGLDEVSSKPLQTEIAREIKKFANFYPDSAVWITSRILGYEEDAPFTPGQFSHYYIAAITMDQACEFIERWYQMQMPDKKDERENRIDSLKKAIKENAGVRRLQTNPLLLTMMAFVHQFEGTLPDDRGRLYEKCIELLLKTWQDQKYISQGEENPLAKIGLRYDDQLRLLAAAAFHIQEKNQDAPNDFARGVIGEKELENKLFEILYDPRRIQKDQARKKIKTFLFYIRDRVGLFVDAGKNEDEDENIFSFFHLSFLEYLCAYQITQDKSKSQLEHIDTLLEYMGKPAWEEILLLALYIFSKSPNGNAFLDSFIERAFNRLAVEPAPYIWYLLGRAVRDNISLTFDDIYKIIKGLLELWLIDNNNQVSPKIIHEIVDFSPDGREFLEKILKENIRNNSAPQAFASLNFFTRYFVVNDEIIDAITNNSDSLNLLPYLPVFQNNKLLSRFVQQNLEEFQWMIYYNSVKDHTGENLDRIINYKINDRELIGYLLSAWTKIFNVFGERRQFLGKNNPTENSGLQPGNIGFDFGYAFLKYPLHLFRLFIEPTTVMLDFPGNIDIYRISNEIFISLGKSIYPGLNQAYVYTWINWILEKGLGDLAKHLTSQYELAPEELNQIKEVRQRYSAEFGWYLSNEISKYLSEEFIEDLMHLLNDALQQDFSRYYIRDFNLYLSQDFKRNNTQYFSKGFSRFIESEFGLELNHSFIRYFFMYCTPEICREYIRNCWQKFNPEFREMISNTYAKFYGRKINWADFDSVDQQALYNCFLDQFMENNEPFIDNFYTYLYDYLFFRKLRIQFSEQPLPSSRPLPGKEIQMDRIKIKLNEQFMFPFTFDFILTAAFNHYIINILANLNNKFYKNVKPTQKMIRGAVEDYCRNHSFLSYIIKETWFLYAQGFKEKTEPTHPLNNLRLTSLLTNAAKVSLITDMPCTGTEWDKLLIEATASNDPFVKVALALYKVAIFEDTRANSVLLYENLQDFKNKYPQYYKLIGFTT